jgi:hypothetical protein
LPGQLESRPYARPEIAAYALAARVDGRGAGTIAALAAMSVLFARTASGPDPLVARLAADVVALRQPATGHPRLHRFFQRATWLWAGIFLLLTAVLAGLMTAVPAGTFMMLFTITTVALTAAGTGASALWFRAVLRKAGLKLRFAPA